jgi:VRR-NUC domain-containing protein
VTRNRPEQGIQRTVFAHLAVRGVRDCFAFHVPNGGWRSRAEAAIMKGLGVRSGVPDLIAIKAGHAYALELKAPAGRLSEAQRGAHAALCAAGATVAVAYDLDDALARLELWQLLRAAHG